MDPLLVALIRSFLTGRIQSVAIGDSKSAPAPVVSGVAQGSVLGPQLFLFLIADLAQIQLSKNAEIFLFADDCVLMKPMFGKMT
jgi:hypothetical protein